MPEPDALPTAKGAPARPWIALVGASEHDLGAIDRSLYTLGLSSTDTPGTKAVSPKARLALEDRWWERSEGARKDPGRWPASRPVAAVLVLSDPLQAASELAVRDGLAPTCAVAVWERFYRMALSNLRGLPVFVTSRPSAQSDPALWAEVVGSFLSAHGAPPLGHGSRSRLSKLLGPAEPDVEAEKDEGLLLESQRQLAVALDELVGSHDRFEPAPPEPESVWVTDLLNSHRDLEQVFEGLDWATKRLASLLGQVRSGHGGAAVPYPLNASEDLGAYHRWLERRGGAADAAAERRATGGERPCAPPTAAAVQRRRPRAPASFLGPRALCRLGARPELPRLPARPRGRRLGRRRARGPAALVRPPRPPRRGRAEERDGGDLRRHELGHRTGAAASTSSFWTTTTSCTPRRSRRWPRRSPSTRRRTCCTQTRTS